MLGRLFMTVFMCAAVSAGTTMGSGKAEMGMTRRDGVLMQSVRRQAVSASDKTVTLERVRETGEKDSPLLREISPVKRPDFGRIPEADELVRVIIEFEKDAVDNSSLEELIGRITEEAFDGEDWDIHMKKEYYISANIPYGRIRAVEAVEGVKSVDREREYGLIDPVIPSMRLRMQAEMVRMYLMPVRRLTAVLHPEMAAGHKRG